MNQIEVLKNISEFGNPKDRPEVLKYYNQYKSDPTFRSLAISLAESETGYSSLDDSTKQAYQTYKDSLLSPKQVSEEKSFGRQALESSFPRIFSDDISASSIPGKGYELAKDIITIPGRGLYSGILAGLNAIGGEENIGQKAIENFGQYGGDPSQGLLANMAKDALTNPLNLVPGVGTLATGVGKVASKIIPGATKAEYLVSRLPSGPVAQALTHGAGEGVLNVGLGKLEGSDDASMDFATGFIGGLIPGTYSGMKSNTRQMIGEDIVENVRREYPDLTKKYLKNPQEFSLISGKLDEAKTLNDWLVSNNLSKPAPKDFEGRIRQYEQDVEIFRKLPAPKAEEIPGLGFMGAEQRTPSFQEVYPGTERLQYIREMSPESHSYPRLKVDKIQPGAMAEIVGNNLGLTAGIPTVGRILTTPGVSEVGSRMLQRTVENTNPLFSGLAGIVGRSLYRPISDNTKK